MLDLHTLHRTLHPCLTPGSHHSKHNTFLEVPQAESTNLYLPVFVSNSSFSAEEEGLVLCICRCSSIGIKARGFQARLQPPFRTAPHPPPPAKKRCGPSSPTRRESTSSQEVSPSVTCPDIQKCYHTDQNPPLPCLRTYAG